MSSSKSKLDNKVKELENKIEALTDLCNQLEWRVTMLTCCKIDHPRFPYWILLLERNMPEETRRRLTLLLGALNDRVTGHSLPDEYKKDIEGVSRDLLYGSGPPRVADVVAAIKTVTGMKHDTQVLKLIQAVHEQGILGELCEYVLSALTFEPGPRTRKKRGGRQDPWRQTSE